MRSGGEWWGRAVTVTALACLVGCTGGMNLSGEGAGSTGAGSTGAGGTGGARGAPVRPGAPALGPDRAAALPGGLRRLTQQEYASSVVALLGEAGRPGGRLAFDEGEPFGNAYADQVASAQLIENAESLAQASVEAALADEAGRDALIGCRPTHPADEVCLARFVDRVGPRALRRPLEDDERAGLLALGRHGAEAQDFSVGVALILQALLQHAEFLYRPEVGSPTGEPSEGLYALSGYEIAGRMSYLLWGGPPDEALREAAASGALLGSAGRRQQAERMVKDPSFLAWMQEFHALWLGYARAQLPGGLAEAMREETDRLVAEAVGGGDWRELLRAERSWLTPALAEHYGLPVPQGEGGWVDYSQGSGRGGVLSHASFLAVGAKVGVTSPTDRGKFLRERLLCQTIQPPPPTVNVDELPEGVEEGSCKSRKHVFLARESGGCSGCHVQMDLIGLGLEAFDAAGRWRAHEPDRADCPIDGQGELFGVGSFQGPGQLGQLLANDKLVHRCAVRRVVQFGLGLAAPPPANHPYVAHLAARFQESHYSFATLLIEMVAAEPFAFRREASDDGEGE